MSNDEERDPSPSPPLRPPWVAFPLLPDIIPLLPAPSAPPPATLSPPLEDAVAIALECQLCGNRIALADFHDHMLHVHPTTYIVLLGTAYPHLSDEELINSLFPDEPSDMSYEEMMEICDTIGYHYVGVEDIDACAPMDAHPRAITMDRCAICLEEGEGLEASQGATRTITACGHQFCAPCIQEWLGQHKTCPICKKDVTASADQMASTSTSESSPSPGSSSASLDAVPAAPAGSPDASSPSMNIT